MRLFWTLGWLIGCQNAAMDVENADNLIGDSDRPVWDPDAQPISNSSSSSNVAWTPPDDEDGEPEYYAVTVTSEFGRVAFQDKVFEPKVELTGLRTDTEYGIEITACYDQDCTDALDSENSGAASWRTEVEAWHFPQIDGDRIEPLLENAYAPNLIDLSTLPIDRDGWVLTTIQQNGWEQQVHVSTLRGIMVGNDGMDLTFDLETPLSAGLQDVPSVIELSSSSARPVEIDGQWQLQLFASLEANIDSTRSMIGSWTSNTGIDGISLYDDVGGVCELASLVETCGMNTCMDSQEDSPFTLNRMECISILPKASNLMLVQGRADADDETPSNLYLVKAVGNGVWDAVGNGAAEPLLKDATGASVDFDGDVAKLYYWDENSGTAYIRFWDPNTAGEEDTLDIEDLESAERVRNVYYKDSNGEQMLPWNFKVVERSFLTFEGKKFMLATVENADGQRHVTVAVLRNP
jgi:hypothetical protein